MGSYRAQPAPVERRARVGDQGNNKPSTNRSPRRTDSDSQTKRVEFCARPARQSSKLSRRLGPVPFPPALRRIKHRRISRLPNQRQRPADALESVSQRRPDVKSGCRSLPLPLGSLPRSGTQAKGSGTKGAGISDAGHRPIRQPDGNPDSAYLPRSVKSWRLLG